MPYMIRKASHVKGPINFQMKPELINHGDIDNVASVVLADFS
jgi:hypothetical protein